jgi:hypothetical protein
VAGVHWFPRPAAATQAAAGPEEKLA